VSVVTPFFNTAPYLAECMESVLAQTYSHFEYILMDNCSTDGSSEIAATYAQRDPRIRLIRCSEFLPQLANYNRALAKISEDSVYCKIVQADDWIFPECLQLMVQVFEQSEATGLVSSYWLEGNSLFGSGYPLNSPILRGRECAQWFLRTEIRIFGSQTTVMYRSSLVRQQGDFYNVAFPNAADLENCMEILKHCDFGFVYQVLSFVRRDNESIISAVIPFQSNEVYMYIILRRYATVFLEGTEAAGLRRKSKRQYYRSLARAAFQFRGRAFWRFHKTELKATKEGEKLDWPYLTLQVAIQSLWIMSNPGKLMLRAIKYFRHTAKIKDDLLKVFPS
jgi:glycosyltransferase involved in cell wall biosynthesis